MKRPWFSEGVTMLMRGQGLPSGRVAGSAGPSGR
jgi:hypothetical protein